MSEGWNLEDISELVKQLWKVGYSLVKSTGSAKAQILALHYDNVMLDFKFCYEDEQSVYYYCWGEATKSPILHVYPKHFFELGMIELNGKEYPCPQPIEAYIIHHYGHEWRKFKARAKDAGKTDLTWDYMKDPPCMMTLEEFEQMKGHPPMVGTL